MKKILTLSLMTVAGFATILSLTSSSSASQGVMGAASNNQGCGSCHGSMASANTTINVTGIPAAGYVPGTTYPITMTISNATKTGAGFDLFFTSGTISGAPAGTMLMQAGRELHHTQRFSMTGTYTCNFNWTAPASGAPVTLTVSGNAVNSNNNDSGDEWNKVQFTYTAAPNNVNDIKESVFSVFPNPASQTITLETESSIPVSQAYVVDLSGRLTHIPVKANQGSLQLNIANLADGYYQLNFIQGSARNTTSFLKK